MQRLMVRIFHPQLAQNALFGVLLGSVLAFVAGIVVSWFLLAGAHALVPNTPGPVTFVSEDNADRALSIVALHNTFRDGLELFLVAHGAGIHVEYGNGTTTANGSSFAPLHGLLVLPALLLMLGGFIAACTDVQNRIQSGLLRGAAVALPYTILLLIITSQVNGVIAGGEPGIADTLSVDVPTLVVFGLLWGALFGMLGASLKLAQGHWRHRLHRYIRTMPRMQLAGTIIGGLIAAAIGLSLSLLVLYCLLAYVPLSVPLLQHNICMQGDWQFLTLWGMAQGPLHAANLYFFSLGAPIAVHGPQQGEATCFYSSIQQSGLTWRDGNLHLSPWVAAVLLLPAISLFVGGRISAAIARQSSIGPAAVQGAFIALPFTLLMMLLTTICTITISISGSTTVPGSPVSPSITQSVGVGMFDLPLLTLLFGVVFGALGGAYQAAHAQTFVRKLLTALTAPLRLLAKPLCFVLDRLSGQPRSIPRSHTRNLLYAACICAFVLLIIAGAAGGSLIGFNQQLSLQQSQYIRDIVSVCLIALPGLLLLSACFYALCSDPEELQNPGSPLPVQRGI